jgi:hypothetical protein
MIAKSHEVLRKTVSTAGAKSVASDMALSPSLIYKWCEAKGGDASGADNPLDRLLRLCEITEDSAPVVWLCEQLGGFFVNNVAGDAREGDVELLAMTQRILKAFSEMLDMVSRSIGDDGGVDLDEAQKIRVEWEELKRVAEQFVLQAEAGRYMLDQNANGIDPA